MADLPREGERKSGIHSSPNFQEKMEVPRKAIFSKDWGSFRSFFEKNPKAIMEPLDLSGNTAVHFAATRWNKPELLRELLDILPEEADRWRALRKGNAHTNTVLHQVIHCKNVMMVNAVLDYGGHLQVPQDEEGEDKDRPLFELVNDEGETPVYRAAKYGNIEMLKHMYDRIKGKGWSFQKHLYRQRRDDAAPRRTSILHIAIMGQYFEVALWLMENAEGIKEVARENDGNELSCLQLLCGMPSVFRSYDSHMGFTEKLIYACLSIKRYDECSNDDNYDDGTHLAQRQYKESRAANTIQAIFWIALATILFLLPSEGALLSVAVTLASLAILSATINIGKELIRIGKIWEKKKQHKLAEKLADFLVKRDNSWMNSKNSKPQNENVLPLTQLCNLASRERARQDNEEGQHEDPIISKVYTPLLLAASTGIVEIVKKIIDLHPDAIYHVSHDDHNILHVTVKHRQKKIYKLLKKYGVLRRLAARMSNKGCTLLHHAAMMDHYDGGNLQASVVFQLEEELCWFERVKKITPPTFFLYRNDDKFTARELFELEHSNMLNKAQEWITATALSCSTVAVLVATVVFPVAYTVPGGYNGAPDNSTSHGRPGEPVLFSVGSVIFYFSIIMDVVALMSSLLSLMMFLSILTSPFQMQEFKQHLPQKLSSGFIWLFISLTATMLTFGSMILLDFGLRYSQGISILVFSIVVFPFIFSGLTQYSIFMIVKHRFEKLWKKLWKALEKIVPKRFTKLTRRCTKERVYSKYWFEY